LVEALLRVAGVTAGLAESTAGFMTHVTCRLTAKNRDQLRKPTLGNRGWATFTFFTTATAEMASDQTELRDIQELTTTIRKTQLYNYLFYYQPFYHVQHKDIYIEPKLLNKK